MYISEAHAFASEGILVFDEDLQIIQFNTAFLKLTGKLPHELRGIPLSLYLPDINDLKLDQPATGTIKGISSELSRWTIIPLWTLDKLAGGLVLFESQKHFSVRPDTPGDIKDSAETTEIITQQDIVKAILETQEEERKRIAEAIHNELGQLLYAIKLQAERFHPSADPTTQKLAKIQIDNLLEEAIQEVRSISYDLTPRLLEDFGLEYAIRELCKRISHEKLDVICQINLHSFTPAKTLQIALFRIIQELMNNVIKHSSAEKATISLSKKAELLEICVEDNGIGFNPVEVSTSGLGLRSILNRVKLLDGNIHVAASENTGTKFSITIPIK